MKHLSTLRNLLAFGFMIFGLGAHTFAQNSAPRDPAPDTPKKIETPVQPCPEQAELRKVSAEVQRLKRRVAELEKDRLATTIQEQLEKEQQRGEQLQLHLIEIAEKEEPLQARLDQITQQLRPENIDRALAGYGALKPEDAREEFRKRLYNERIRVQAQLELHRQDKMRTQASIATTDAAIQRLKQKLLEALR